MRAPFTFNLVLDWKVYAAFRSIKLALEGDMSVLIERVEGEVNLSHQERKLIARILRGERIRPRHRIRTSEIDRKHESIAKFVYARKHLTGHKQEAIVEDAVKHFGVSRATVMNILKEKRGDPDAERRFDEITKAAVEMMTSEDVADLPVKDVPVVIKGITFPKVE